MFGNRGIAGTEGAAPKGTKGTPLIKNMFLNCHEINMCEGK
jgi:hypothetical protein